MNPHQYAEGKRRAKAAIADRDANMLLALRLVLLGSKITRVEREPSDPEYDSGSGRQNDVTIWLDNGQRIRFYAEGYESPGLDFEVEDA